MAYKTPTDLPQVKLTWRAWPLEARLRAAMARTDAPAWAKLAAVASYDSACRKALGALWDMAALQRATDSTKVGA